ncbi:MAG TPA: tyrosine-type recombinase/integrase [Tepidisphaeraceae bacterium]|jgi:integrase
MPRKSVNPAVPCQYFNWRLRERNGVYFADGRSTKLNLGRHSLNTRDRDEARRLLFELDLEKAIEQGRASPTERAGPTAAPLGLVAGKERYFEHLGRPPHLGGIRPKSLQRYRAAFDKFFKHLGDRGITSWNAVDRAALSAYLGWLDQMDYTPSTSYFEATVVKQAVKWLIGEGLLPASNTIRLKVTRAETTNRYCWRPEEVQVMLDHCFAKPETQWLGRVLAGLATTGLRIGELADLRWSDIDLSLAVLRLPDRVLHTTRSGRHAARSTKGKRDRTFPLHQDLLALLRTLSPHADGRVFRGECGGPLDPDKVRKRLERDVLVPLAGQFPPTGGADEPSFRDGVPHSFRHYFVSAAANRGVPERVVQDWLGHKESRMIAWYYHLHSEQSKEQMRKMSDVAGSADAAWRRSLSPVHNEGSPPGRNDVPEKP